MNCFQDSLGRLWKPQDDGTMKRTFPSWESRPFDLSVLPLDHKENATPEDYRMIRMVEIGVKQKGHDLRVGVHLDVLREVVKEIIGEVNIAKVRTRQIMIHLWRAGLVKRRGWCRGKKERPRYVTWYID